VCVSHLSDSSEKVYKMAKCEMREEKCNWQLVNGREGDDNDELQNNVHCARMMKGFVIIKGKHI